MDSIGEHTDRRNQSSMKTNPIGRQSYRPFLFLVGTKKDLISNESLKFYRNEGAKMADRIGAEFWLVSASSGENVSDLFKRAACLCFDRYLMNEIKLLSQFRETGSPKMSRVNRFLKRSDSKQQIRIDNQTTELPSKSDINPKLPSESYGKNDSIIRKYLSTLWSNRSNWWNPRFFRPKNITSKISLNRKNKVDDIGKNQEKPYTKKRQRELLKCFRFTCMMNDD